MRIYNSRLLHNLSHSQTWSTWVSKLPYSNFLIPAQCASKISYMLSMDFRQVQNGFNHANEPTLGLLVGRDQGQANASPEPDMEVGTRQYLLWLRRKGVVPFMTWRKARRRRLPLHPCVFVFFFLFFSVQFGRKAAASVAHTLSFSRKSVWIFQWNVFFKKRCFSMKIMSA